MDEKDQELIIRYLRYVKRKRIIILSVILLFVSAGILFFILNSNNTNISQEIIENEVNEDVTNSLNNTISENKDEGEVEKKEEPTTEIKSVVEKPKEVVKTSKPSTTTSSTKKEVEQKTKPANKDFLFTDGYTMDNVTQVAQDYLKSSGYAGECIPLQDDEGIYLGMRVIFY